MNNPDRILLKLSALPLREHRRLIRESTEAAGNLEIEQMATALAADIRGLGRATALELLFKIGLKLRGDNERPTTNRKGNRRGPGCGNNDRPGLGGQKLYRPRISARSVDGPDWPHFGGSRLDNER